MKPSKIWEMLKAVFSQWLADEPFQQAAALAYYTIFSLAPLLLIFIAIIGFAFWQEAARNQVLESIQDLIGYESARAIQELIRNAGTHGAGFWATASGTVLLLLGAGGVVGQLQSSLNKIFRVTAQANASWLHILRARFLSFALILGVGFLLLVSLIVTAVLSAVSHFFSGVLPGGEALWHLIDTVTSFGFITVLFALIYKILPDIVVPWKNVWLGAAITSLLFSLGKLAIGIYLGHSSVASTYGAAGSLVTVLVWVYYSALIFFLGAELTQYYSTHRTEVQAEN